jgi:transposase
VLEWRALLELYHDLRAEHTGWAQRIHAACFHQGTTPLGEAGVIRGQARPRLERIAEVQLSPVGRQVMTALAIMDTLAEHVDQVRHSGSCTPPGTSHLGKVITHWPAPW